MRTWDVFFERMLFFNSSDQLDNKKFSVFIFRKKTTMSESKRLPFLHIYISSLARTVEKVRAEWTIKIQWTRTRFFFFFFLS